MAHFLSMATPLFILFFIAKAIHDQSNGIGTVIKDRIELAFLIASLATPIIVQQIHHLITGECLHNNIIMVPGLMLLAVSAHWSFKNNQTFDGMASSVLVKASIFMLCILAYDGMRYLSM